MEVGAVKQAFNNEVIQLKKNLNQAKIQVIHKLTRKAKTLTEKKAPDHLKEKNKKKAESAVKEVLLMKKLKPRDIARFIITHKGELNSHLNKPIVDSDKACARLLLHKSLQPKYKIIKNKFGDIPIKDLLMSRQERRKLKKEAKDAQKNKKKGKEGKVINSQGDWNVEEVEMGDDSKEISQNDDTSDDDSDDGNKDEDVSNDGNQDDCVSNDGNQDDHVSNDDSQEISDDDIPVTRQVVNDSDESSEGEQTGENDDQDSIIDSDDENMEKQENSDDNQGQNNGSGDEIVDTRKLVELKPVKQTKSPKTPNFLIPKPVQPVTANIDVLLKPKPKKKPDKKVKEHKNKNLIEKMLNRAFKKDADGSQIAEKVVDPFFKTATGGSYMSVAEPRQPDEVKEVHMQGNRQERRAAMFGRAPNKPRKYDRQNFRAGNSDNRSGTESNGKFKIEGNDRRAKFNDRNSKFNDRSSNFNDNHSKFMDRNSTFNDRNTKFNDKNLNNSKITEPKEEKLHPSWEAKKKQSGILPYKGKKIVFDES